MLALLLATVGCAGCASAQVRDDDVAQRFVAVRDSLNATARLRAMYAHPTLEQRDHGVRVGFVTDSVQATLDAAQRDTIERIFQITRMVWHQLPPDQQGLPGDSMFYVLAIVECPLDSASYLHAWGPKCPNRAAPQIHTHVSLASRGMSNSSDPSPYDWRAQYVRRTELDGIVAGQGDVRWYYFRQNPYRRPGDLPRPADSVAVVTHGRVER